MCSSHYALKKIALSQPLLYTTDSVSPTRTQEQAEDDKPAPFQIERYGPLMKRYRLLLLNISFDFFF